MYHTGSKCVPCSNTNFAAVNVKTQNNQIIADVNGANKKGIGIDYFGKNVKIVQKSASVIMINN